MHLQQRVLGCPPLEVPPQLPVLPSSSAICIHDLITPSQQFPEIGAIITASVSLMKRWRLREVKYFSTQPGLSDIKATSDLCVTAWGASLLSTRCPPWWPHLVFTNKAQTAGPLLPGSVDILDWIVLCGGGCPPCVECSVASLASTR